MSYSYHYGDDGAGFGIFMFTILGLIALGFCIWLVHSANQAQDICHQKGGVVVRGHCVKEIK